MCVFPKISLPFLWINSKKASCHLGRRRCTHVTFLNVFHSGIDLPLGKTTSAVPSSPIITWNGAEKDRQPLTFLHALHSSPHP